MTMDRNAVDDKTLFKNELKNYVSDQEYTIFKIKWASMSKHFATNSAQAITVDNSLIYKNFNLQEYYYQQNYFNNYIL